MGVFRQLHVWVFLGKSYHLTILVLFPEKKVRSVSGIEETKGHILSFLVLKLFFLTILPILPKYSHSIYIIIK